MDDAGQRAALWVQGLYALNLSPEAAVQELARTIRAAQQREREACAAACELEAGRYERVAEEATHPPHRASLRADAIVAHRMARIIRARDDGDANVNSETSSTTAPAAGGVGVSMVKVTTEVAVDAVRERLRTRLRAASWARPSESGVVVALDDGDVEAIMRDCCVPELVEALLAARAVLHSPFPLEDRVIAGLGTGSSASERADAALARIMTLPGAADG